jgi:predicted negative regulator of RcsB-dependent stress response
MSSHKLLEAKEALTLFGDVEFARGNPEPAREAYRRALEIAEQLRADFGATSEALRDLSLSLNKVGDVELALGDKEGALEAYSRGLGVRQRLLGDFGTTPEALRDVSLSLNRVGDVELALGDRNAALAAYRHGLQIRERLLAECDETPEGLCDLSASLDRVGDVELALGQQDAALDAYRRGLELRERLLADFGETPEALRDLSRSRGKLADVERALGQGKAVQEVYDRGQEIRDRVHSPEERPQEKIEASTRSVAATTRTSTAVGSTFPRIVFVLLPRLQAIGALRGDDPTERFAVPASEHRWHLEPAPPHCTETDEGPAYSLPEAVARNSYNVPAGVSVDLRIDLLVQPGPQPGLLAPVVEVSPGPQRDREPLHFVLWFAEDCVREFVIRPHPLLNKDFLRSDPVEPIPAAIVERWLTAQGSNTLSADFRVEGVG